jgi:hypothetical protein
MKIEELIGFFGLPAQNTDFDKYLKAHDIDDRPKFDPETGNPTERIALPDQGLSLEFIQPDSYLKNFGGIRQDGGMLFARILVYALPEEDFKPYSGPVLTHVSTDITQEDALAQFGKPFRIRDEGDRFGRANNIEYTWKNVDGIGLYVRFIKNPPAVKIIMVSPPSL